MPRDTSAVTTKPDEAAPRAAYEDIGLDAAPPSEDRESEPPPARHRLRDPTTAWGRLTFSGAVGLIAPALTWRLTLPFHGRAIVGWDAGALTYCVLTWIMIARASPESTHRRASVEDPGRRFVFGLALLASLFSLFAAVVVMRRVRLLSPELVSIWTGLALAAVALSWIVTHTLFTLRYAHLYYRQHESEHHCFDFPGTDLPSDLDFAYFAFTIGMCFQVSDVTIKSTRARRAVLLHAIMSFVYNTTILALSLNLVTTLLG